MKQYGRNHGRRLIRVAVGPILAGMLGVVGCDAPEKGTVQITPETRSQLLPHAGGGSKDGKGPATPGKPASIKDRNRAPASP